MNYNNWFSDLNNWIWKYDGVMGWGSATVGWTTAFGLMNGYLKWVAGLNALISIINCVSSYHKNHNPEQSGEVI